MPTFGSLFAGIGGIDLGLERAGWTGRWQVEYEPFCQRVLAKHWPDVHRVGDVHDAHGADYCPVADAEHARPHREADDSCGREPNVARGGRGSQPSGLCATNGTGTTCPNCLPYVDLIAGGFPCQPVSTAGRRLIQADDRWLWPEFARCIRELRPRYVLVENVPGLLVGGGMDDVLGDLADLGYSGEWESIPAAAVGAPHLRYRVWIVAYPNGQRQGRPPTLGPPSLTGLRPGEAGAEPDGAGARTLADAGSGRQPRSGQPLDSGHPTADASQTPDEPLDGRLGHQWSVEPDVGRVAHGVPARVDRLRSLGNAVVPQVVEWIGRRIIEAEEVTA